jgi:UDP-GlcNAc:undecaprenyl-phosphate/decaprenyl-phosphate GlcNAc-1-phosphate transferase
VATTLFFSFLGSLVICMALIPPLMASAGQLHMLDLPGGRRMHSGSMAKVGGIALAVGASIGMLMWGPKDQAAVASLLGGAIILLFGMWDDRVGLTYRTKFAGQALAAFVVIAFGGVQISSLPMIQDAWFSPWIGIPLTFLTLIAVTNAVNLSDGLDGLAGGLTLISFAGTAYLALQTDNAFLMLMVVSVLGGLLGFLRFNSYPAKIFMGDAGSQFLGFFLGVTGLVLTNPAHGPYSLMLAFFVWGLPVLDMLGVTAQRLHEGRSPFVGDRNHLHHKLLGLGWAHRQAVMLIYLGQAAMVALGYLLRWQSDWVLVTIYLVVAGCIVSLFIRSTTNDTCISVLQEVRQLGKNIGWIERYPGLAYLPRHVLALAVTGFLLASVVLPHTVPSDAGVIAAGLFLVIAIGMRCFPLMTPVFVRAGLYVGSTFLLYFGEFGNLPGTSPWMRPDNLFFIGLAGLVVLVLRLSLVRQFETTPLDSLMVLLAMLFPFLPELHVGDINLSVLSAKLMVLFFAFELVLHAYAERVAPAGLVALWLLGGLVVRAWW